MISYLPGGKPEAHVKRSRAWRESVDLMAVNALAARRPGGPMAGNNHYPVRAAHLGRCEPANCATASGSSRVRSEMKLVINGADVELDGRYAKTPLPWVLRDVVGLHGTKFGCGAGFCAARTVLIDGRSTKSCQTATERAVCKAITTVEGGLRPGCRRRPQSQAVSAGSMPRDMRRSSEKVDPLRCRIDSGTGVSGALTMPVTSLQAAAEEVVKRDPGLRRAHRSSRTSLIPSASLVI